MDATKFNELTNFEHNKLSEILGYVNKCKGFLPEIGLLSSRLMKFAKHYDFLKNRGEQGLSPFVFGRDYRPDMNYQQRNFIASNSFAPRQAWQEDRKRAKLRYEAAIRTYVQLGTEEANMSLFENQITSLSSEYQLQFLAFVIQFRAKNFDFCPAYLNFSKPSESRAPAVTKKISYEEHLKKQLQKKLSSMAVDKGDKKADKKVEIQKVEPDRLQLPPPQHNQQPSPRLLNQKLRLDLKMEPIPVVRSRCSSRASLNSAYHADKNNRNKTIMIIKSQPASQQIRRAISQQKCRDVRMMKQFRKMKDQIGDIDFKRLSMVC